MTSMQGTNNTKRLLITQIAELSYLYWHTMDKVADMQIESLQGVQLLKVNPCDFEPHESQHE